MVGGLGIDAPIEERLRSVFASYDTEGFLHAIDLGGGEEIALNADEPVVAASVFKIPVLLELMRQASAGSISLSERVTVTSEDRAFGPTGLSVFQDDAEMSLRDLVVMMMTISDNTATDLVMDRVGLDRINATLRELGLESTVLVGDCMDLLGTLPEDLGLTIEETVAQLPTLPSERLLQWRGLHPERTTRTTSRDATTLLRLIAHHQAAPADACIEIRRVMSLQFAPHRLRSGFPSPLLVWGKTGTLPGVYNEVGVVEYPDGSAYAVAVFTRSSESNEMNPKADRAIGKAAALAVAELRAGQVT